MKHLECFGKVSCRGKYRDGEEWVKLNGNEEVLRL